jgi:putative phosphoribosyl transferase
MRFDNREHGGQLLAERLSAYQQQPNVLVLGLPRGGVPVASVVAKALHAPLDVLMVRKLGMPTHPEYAMGAIASGGVRVMNPDAAFLGISAKEIEAVAAHERLELARRERLYRAGRPALALKGLTVILVDDGLATGSTMRAAVLAARRAQAQRIVVAVPVAAPETAESLRSEADEVVCVATPVPLRAVGLWYDDFEQVSDDAVRALLAQGGSGAPAP